MTGPADIPSFGPPPEADEPPDGVRNDLVRAAVEAFAESPGRETMIDVLRACLHGPLLLDITGSDLRVNDEGELEDGSQIELRGAEDDDGGQVLFGFTSQQEIERTHEAGANVQSLVQSGPEILELCRAQGATALHLDPAGPASCALGAEEIEFALAVERNDDVRAAVEPGAPREALIAALRENGTLALAVEPPEGGELPEDGAVAVRTVSPPEGEGIALAVFTSGPEALALVADDHIVTQQVEDVVAQVLDGPYTGILINPGGPWTYIDAEELRAVVGS